MLIRARTGRDQAVERIVFVGLIDGGDGSQ